MIEVRTWEDSIFERGFGSTFLAAGGLVSSGSSGCNQRGSGMAQRRTGE